MRMRRLLAYLLLSSALLFVFSSAALAQFKEEAFQQNYNDDQSDTSSVDVLFSFKNYFRGISHKEEVKPGVVFAGSLLFVGGEQIYNRQYWKLPVIYGGIAAGVGSGIYFNNLYKQSVGTEFEVRNKYISNACFIGAGLVYWGALMDGVYNMKKDEYPVAAKATIYSILCPGLGQIYNGEAWKLPIYWGGMVAGLHFYNFYSTNYERFRRIYKEAGMEGNTSPVTEEQALYYRDIYRRYRDYSILAVAAVYLLQVIDANVFAYMHNFEIDDNLALDVSPALITPDTKLAASGNYAPAFGLRLGFNF